MQTSNASCPEMGGRQRRAQAKRNAQLDEKFHPDIVTDSVRIQLAKDVPIERQAQEAKMVAYFQEMGRILHTVPNVRDANKAIKIFNTFAKDCSELTNENTALEELVVAIETELLRMKYRLVFQHMMSSQHMLNRDVLTIVGKYVGAPDVFNTKADTVFTIIR